jgi:hypothetical protein
MNALASSFLNAGIVYISQPVNYVINSEPASISDTRETLESCLPPPPSPPPHHLPLTHSFTTSILPPFFLYNLHSLNSHEKLVIFFHPDAGTNWHWSSYTIQYKSRCYGCDVAKFLARLESMSLRFDSWPGERSYTTAKWTGTAFQCNIHVRSNTLPRQSAASEHIFRLCLSTPPQITIFLLLNFRYMCWWPGPWYLVITNSYALLTAFYPGCHADSRLPAANGRPTLPIKSLLWAAKIGRTF